MKSNILGKKIMNKIPGYEANYEAEAAEIQEKRHLTFPGAKPIIVSIDEQRRMGLLGFYNDSEEHIYRIKNSKTTREVDYYAPDENTVGEDKDRYLSNGPLTYVFSPIDNKDKYTEYLMNCTAFIIAGINKNTGKNVSCMSHQDPSKFLNDYQTQFLKDTVSRLENFKRNCIPGSIDAVIVGGNYMENPAPDRGGNYKQEYLDSINLISENVKKVLGFEPVVVNGPKTQLGSDNAYYQNDERRLFFIRPQRRLHSGDFTKSDLDKKPDHYIKKWEN